MKKNRGRFIVLEGLDGSGTTTQTRHLAKWLEDQNLTVKKTFEPTDGPVGKLIRNVLSRKPVSSDSNTPASFSEDALCLLFAADRIEHSHQIREWQAGGRDVVCDRYVHSSIAYQSLGPSISAERVVETNRGVAVPDLTIFLDIPVEACLERLQGRNESPSVYEKKNILAQIHRNYLKTAALYAEHFGPIYTVDGSRSVAEVTEAIKVIVGKLRKGVSR
ncbi:MAG: dTMP kinase [bacterium]|nr:dTMP kinase [bacterium]